jgi:nicotinate-nucleotide pyrophosphorylase (carboxylating)
MVDCVSSSVRGILSVECTTLNLVQRLSGIAMLTTSAGGNLPGRMLNTRKTISGLRVLEKYAIRVSGGLNHLALLPAHGLRIHEAVAALSRRSDGVGQG